MEETLSCIARGCKLARELESNLPNLAKQTRMLSSSCDEIMNIFRVAKERLDADQIDNSSQYVQVFAQGGLGIDTQEWLRTSYLQALQAQYGGGIEPSNLSAQMSEGSARSTGSGGGGGGGEIQADSGNSNSQRSRTRKDDTKKRMVTVAAPRIGNTDVPPDDNFTWRKYGQKEILGSKYPRSYYRCTHQKLYNCPAKKQVQRLDSDPFMFDITYIDEHTCHKSATAPSIPPPPPPEMRPDHQVIHTTAAHLPMGSWLSMDLGLGEGGGGGGGGGSSSSMVAGPSTVRFSRDQLEYPVVDLADTMFNSGSSSSNSMDLIFTTMEDKWEQPAADKKN